MRGFWLLLCVVILLISCQASTVPPIEVSLKFIHLDGHSVSRQAGLTTWQVSELAAASPQFEVFHLRVGSREYVCDDLLNVHDSTTKRTIVISQQAKDKIGRAHV